jgi:hypothetical protein
LIVGFATAAIVVLIVGFAIAARVGAIVLFTVGLDVVAMGAGVVDGLAVPVAVFVLAIVSAGFGVAVSTIMATVGFLVGSLVAVGATCACFPPDVASAAQINTRITITRHDSLRFGLRFIGHLLKKITPAFQTTRKQNLHGYRVKDEKIDE